MQYVIWKPDIGKIYLFNQDLDEAKYELLFNKCEGVGLKHCNDSKAFIEYLNDMDDTYENIEEFQSN